MISLCTVILDDDKNHMGDYVQVFRENVLKNTKHVKEVLMAKVDSHNDLNEEWEEGGIVWKKFGCMDEIEHMYLQPGFQHAHGIHECIARSTQEYIYFTDPDMFFYCKLDDFYLNLMKQYQLDYIGTSHHAATSMAMQFFPWIGNTLVQKSKLPGPDFLAGRLKARSDFRIIGRVDEDACEMPGKYLVLNPIPELMELYPNPDGNYDTGHLLWVWAVRQKWRWLAFQTVDCHTYTSSYNRGNVQVGKLPKQKLLYHAVSGTIDPRYWEGYKKAWDEAQEEEDD